jgi:hypothetical protein
MKSAFIPGSLHSIYVKIFTNYLQLVFLTAQFSLAWPEYVIDVLIVQTAADAPDQIFSFDCYIDTKKHDPSVDSYYYKLILLSLVPIVIMLSSFIFWLMVSLLRESYNSLKRELLTTVIVLFLLVYPNIVRTMFSHFGCREVDMIGNFLEKNMNIECWKGTHITYSLSVALPSIIIWAL